MVEETAVENTDSNGNFEQEYLEGCKKLNVKPLNLLKFGPTPPPLPLKEVDLPQPTSRAQSAGRKKSIFLDELKSVADLKLPVPSRKVVNERREISIQEFLKKGQIDFGSATNILGGSAWTRNTTPYESRYRYTPTICTESTVTEEGEDEVIYKVQIRGFKVDVGTFEVLFSVVLPNLPNLVQINLWNCGMNDQHLQILTQIVSSGNIRQLSLDQNPMISELNYPNLIGEDSFLRVLSLRGNNISDTGAKALAAALKQNRVLLSLSLFDNKIQKSGAEAIGEALRFNNVLQSISFAKNNFGDDGVKLLCKTLSNYLLSPEEVQNRKKQLSEIERLKNDLDEEAKKKGGRRGVSSASKPGDKDKKGNNAAKGPGGKKPEPPPQRTTKSPEDPKIKKVIQAAVDDKKGTKKPATAAGKGKKGKEDGKDESEDVLDAAQIEPMFEVNNQWYILGNRSLNNLDLAWNGITEMGIKYLYDTVVEQDLTADQAVDGMLGLFRIRLSHNIVMDDSILLQQLNSLLLSRNPFYEAVEDGNESNGNTDSQAGDIEDPDEKSHLEVIFYHSEFPVRGMDLYQLTFDCCTAYPEPFTDELLQGILAFLSDFCDKVRLDIVNSESPVIEYAQKFKKYNEATIYINTACDYLNRQLKRRCNPHKSGPVDKLLQLNLEAHSHMVWQSHVLQKMKNFNENLIIFRLLGLIRDHRDGHVVPIEEIKITIDSLLLLNHHSLNPTRLYEDEFEKGFSSETVDYYASEANIKVNTLPIQEFISVAFQRIQEEEKRLDLFLPSQSKAKISGICDHEYISQHLDPLSKEFERQILAECVNECNLLYRLVSRVTGGITHALSVFEQHVSNRLIALVRNVDAIVQKEPSGYIEKLVELRKQLLAFCQQSFNGDPVFEAALDKTFRNVLNSATLNPHFQYPEGFAKYCDLLLKRGSKSPVSDLEIEFKIKGMLSLFSYLDDKDLFQKFYARLLAKRLLYSSSLSFDIEMSIVSMLKELCGYEFTSKMQRMFTDVTLSSELNSEFSNQKTKRSCDFNVMVLTTGSWPIPLDNNSNYRLPIEIEQGITEFNAFYLDKLGRVGRRLTWNHHFSRGEIRTDFLDKKYEISLSLKQLVLILPFNDETTFTTQRLSEITGFSDAEVQRIAKTWLDFDMLIAKENTIELNMNFTNKRLKLKLPPLTSADSKEETNTTKKVVDEDRRFYIQAVIVRVMKSKQVLSHQGLIDQVLQQSKSQFHPSIALIKKCIEGLIEKGFIERTEEKDHYQYIA